MAKATKSATAKQRARVPALYLGCFVFDRPGETSYQGSFQVVVQATSPRHAVECFGARLRALHASPVLFDGEPVTIYLDGFIALEGSFERGVLLNVEQAPSDPRPTYSITCTLPDQDGCDALAYEWRADSDDGDNEGSEEVAFLDFGGKALSRALAKATSTTNAVREPRQVVETLGNEPTTDGIPRAAERKGLPSPDRSALALTLAELDGPGEAAKPQRKRSSRR